MVESVELSLVTLTGGIEAGHQTKFHSKVLIHISILHWNWTKVFQRFFHEKPWGKCLNWMTEQECLRLRPYTLGLHSWNSDLNLENFVTPFLYVLDEYKEAFDRNQKCHCRHWYLHWNEKLHQKQLVLTNVSIFIFDWDFPNISIETVK